MQGNGSLIWVFCLFSCCLHLVLQAHLAKLFQAGLAELSFSKPFALMLFMAFFGAMAFFSFHAI